jgi:hypothetical protein
MASLAIENCKGYVHVILESGGGGRTSGFYSISPEIPEGEGSKVVILGIPIGFQEIVQPTVTLDDKRILYVFGTAWSSVTVLGQLLLGDASTGGDQVKKLLDWYDQNRVSQSEAPIRLSLGTTGLNAYLTGLRLEQADPRFNTQMFSLQLLTAETQSAGI